MKRCLIVLMLVATFCLVAQSNFDSGMSDFEAYKNQQNVQEKNYYKWVSNFKSYQDEQFIQYEKFLEEKWGEFKESSPKTWVGYTEDFNGRTSVDFDANKVVVEVVIEEDTPPEEIKKKLSALTAKILEEKDETGTAILEDQVANPSNPKVSITAKEVESIVQDLPLEEKKVGNKKVYSISLNLVSNSDKKRIAKYAPFISKYCKEAGIEPALALAIIKTESCFNPKAYNRTGNAYGMMQIVPKYAGLTMNKMLYNKNKKPGGRTLFNAEKNLRMGINFLGYLQNKSWKKVTNKTNKRYCVVSSYNGGNGAIYIALAGRTKKIGQKKWDKMMNLLNSDKNKKVYNLIHKKSWEETRHYIKVVEERYAQYLGYNSRM